MNRQITNVTCFNAVMLEYTATPVKIWVFLVIFDLLRRKINRGNEIRRDAQRRS